MSEQAAEPVAAAAPAEEQPKENSSPEKEEIKENGTGEAEAAPEPEAPKDMRAVGLTGFGGTKNVKILKKPEPTLNESEVLIRVKACTSQEVTLDDTFCGSNEPLPSVEEFQKNIKNLRRENFHLKYKISYLEKRMDENFKEEENPVNQNMELLVEVKSLKYEIQEKHELLCQAVKEKEEHKKVVDSKNDEIAELQQKLEELRLKAETRKEHLKQISDLEVQLQNKNKEISEIQNRAGKDESVKSTQGKVSDLNASGLQNQQSDTENTMAESKKTNHLLVPKKEYDEDEETEDHTPNLHRRRKKRMGRSADFCQCTTNNCSTKRCGCKKHGSKCTEKCFCSELCEN